MRLNQLCWGPAWAEPAVLSHRLPPSRRNCGRLKAARKAGRAAVRTNVGAAEDIFAVCLFVLVCSRCRLFGGRGKGVVCVSMLWVGEHEGRTQRRTGTDGLCTTAQQKLRS